MLTRERIAHLRKWDEVHGLDMLETCKYGKDAAALITNWDGIREGLHEALNEVERLRALLAGLAETGPAALDQNQRPYCLYCGTPARWDGDADRWALAHHDTCPWLRLRD